MDMDKATILELRSKIQNELSNVRPGDDSIVGFNLAWDVVNRVLWGEEIAIERAARSDLSRLEKEQLLAISYSPYSQGSPYWWGVKTMPKLAARGLVAPHPKHSKAWRITEDGKVVASKLALAGLK